MEAEGAAFLPLFSPIRFFFPTSVFQVYVSYDYGRSFRRISEKLNFGEGNSSEAVIAQFYHSPADNKRVRTSPVVTAWGCLLGPWLRYRRAGRCSAWASLPRDRQLGTVFLLTWESVTECHSQGRAVHNQAGQVLARQDF